MSQPVEVEARFDTHGRPTPLAFLLDGRRYPIIDWGRRWTDAAGQHFLVMVPGSHIVQLSFSASDHTWTAERVSGGPAVA